MQRTEHESLNQWATTYKGLLSPVARKVEVEMNYGNSLRDPSFILVSVWMEAPKQRTNLLSLARSITPRGWKIWGIRTRTKKTRVSGWQTRLSVEFRCQGSKPLAVRWAEEGRPGQENDPAYPLKGH